MAFSGFLFGTPASSSDRTAYAGTDRLKTIGNTVYLTFPHKYIALDSWSTTPNQREEIKAYRDDNSRNLHRVTAAGRKTAIKFTTRPYLTLAEKQEIQTFFTSHETSAAERKIEILFWNEESNSYKSGFFYRPNMEFKIFQIWADTIKYKAFEFNLVEY